MSHSSLDYSQLLPSQVENVIESLGWEIVKEFPGRSVVWQSRTGAKIWVPLDNSVSDYEDIIERIALKLAEVAGVELEDIYLLLRQQYNSSDLIRLRVDSADIRSGKIQFGDGANLFKALEKLISGSLNAVKAIAPKVKKEFWEKSMLYQTQEGSYIVNAYLPLLQEDIAKQISIPEISAKALGREVSKELLKRLTLLKGVFDEFSSKPEGELIERLLLAGFTKNECEAAEDLFGGSGNRNWEIDVIWSSLVDEENQVTKHVYFDHQKSTPAHEIVRKFKQIKTAPTKRLTGRVVSINRDYDKEIGTVRLKCFLKKGEGEISLTARLNDEQYQVAKDANANKKMVSIEGVLNIYQTGKYRRHVMSSVTGIHILQEDFFG